MVDIAYETDDVRAGDGVPAAIDRVQKTAAEVDVLLEQLRDRLDPILLPSEPQPADGDGMAVVRSESDLRLRIDQTTERLGRTAHLARILIDRLDL